MSVTALLLAGCAKPAPSGSASATAAPPAKVHVATVRLETVPSFTEITGTIRPIHRAVLAAKVMGAIEEMPIALGQRVSSGDVLARISAGEISARLTQAQSQLSAARRDLERERALLTKGASTVDMVEGLEDRFDGAQAMVREAEVMLGYATVRAPFDGVVARKLVQTGDLASPGLPLVEVEGANAFHIEAGVPESLAAQLVIDAPMAVEIPATGLTFTGNLAELSSAADAGARTVLAKIAVPPGAVVHSGQFARVQVPGAPVRALFAPTSAVSVAGQMERVFVASVDNRAALRLVKTGAVRGERVEIFSGLEEGERVVLAPPVALREGQALEVVP